MECRCSWSYQPLLLCSDKESFDVGKLLPHISSSVFSIRVPIEVHSVQCSVVRECTSEHLHPCVTDPVAAQNQVC